MQRTKTQQSLNPLGRNATKKAGVVTGQVLPEGMYSHQRPAHRSTTLTTRRYRVTASRSFLDRHSMHMMSFMVRYLQKMVLFITEALQL